MKVQIGGSRNLEPWPAPGEMLEVPDHEAADLIAAGYASEWKGEADAAQGADAAGDGDQEAGADGRASAAGDGDQEAGADGRADTTGSRRRRGPKRGS